MIEYEHNGWETTPETPIERLLLDLSRDTEEGESLAYGTILLSLHNYLEEGVGLNHGGASTVLQGMKESGSIPSADEYEVDPKEALAKLKIGLHADLVPLYASLYGIDAYRLWLPGVMEVILSDHNEEADDCIEAEGYDRMHCPNGLCPIKVVRGRVVKNMRFPDCTTDDYTYMPAETAQMHVAQLDYLVEEQYVSQIEGGMLYDRYKRALAKKLRGFQLDNSQYWF